MSSRHFRKKNQRNFPPPPDESEEEYQPLYAQNSASPYAGLHVSSPSGSERSSERSEEDAQDTACALPAPAYGNANKKKNFKKKGKGKGRFSATGLDEVERSVQEVNAILGAPPPAPAKAPYNQALMVLTVDPKHLNVANELRKLFGPEEGPNRRGRTTNRALLLKRVLIHPNKDTPVYEFNNTGLSMMKYKDKEGRMYFVFNHGDEYQKMHRNFLTRLAIARGSGDIVMNIDEARKKMHVEALLEISDRLFRMEENGVANEILENVVTFLQYVAHPLFILSQNNVRLDYKFMENRPFHVAMLKYMYLLSNKACHRTALEIAKMMLLLDPNDPLALLSLLDILALRSREHEWLIEAVKYFDRQREATLLFNIKFSNSLAHFHVALKNKSDFAEADRLIRDAILAFPPVLLQLLECCHIKHPEIMAHAIFKPDPQTPWSSGASEVYMIYAKMTAPRWTEQPVMTWLMRNVNELCADFNSNPKIQEAAEDWGRSRHTLFQRWPKEYLRHLSVLSSMSKLILETPLTSPAFTTNTCAFDPMYDRSVNRYAYSYKFEPWKTNNPTSSDGSSPIFSQNIRHDYYRMISQIALQTGCYPFMYLTTVEAHQLNQARLGNVPPVPRHVLDNRGVYFLPQEMNDNPPRRAQPGEGGMFAQQQAGYVPGFNLSVANWNPDFVLPNWGKPPPIFTPMNPPPLSRDWAFNDYDDEFSDYDYDDDEENFARDEREMAQAMAGGGPDPNFDDDDDLANTMNSVFIDDRYTQMFRPTNMN